MLPLLKSHYSIGRSLIQDANLKSGEPNKPDQPTTVPDLLQKHGWPKLFVCDDTTAGFYPLYDVAKKNNSSLCFGWRVTMVEDGEKKEVQPGAKITIWVKSEKGWKALIKLATKAQVDLFFNEARLDWKTLHEGWHSDLVLAIPFYDSFLAKNLTTNQQTVPDFRDLKPYVFVENNDIPFDNLLEKGARAYAEAFGLKVVEVKTCNYESRSDVIFYQARRLMDRKTFGGGTIQEPNLEFFSSAEFCVESFLENEYGGGDFEKEFDEPLDLFLPGIRLPQFELDISDREEYGIPDEATDGEILMILARRGYQEKMKEGELNKDRAEEYAARVHKEFQALEKTNFIPYILLLWGCLRFVKKNDLARGSSRGSAGSSLINYLIGITEIDPIEHDLYFERFISVTRSKTNWIDGIPFISGPPDIDVDLSDSARKKVIEYLSNKYPGKFVKLSTYNTKTTKALIKDAGKIIGLFSEDEVKAISDEIPSRFGKVAKPEEVYFGSQNEDGSDKFKKSEKFIKFADANPLVFSCAKKLYGIISNFGSHASAYLVSHDPLDEMIPLQYGTDGEIVTSCDAVVSEKMVIKLDLLGLQSVELLNNVCKSVGINRKKIDLNSWDNVYKHLQDLKSPSNLFQISGDAAVRGLQKIKPKDFNQLSAVLAICRPGSFVFIDQYADFMNGKTERPNLHPLFDDILEKTGYICLYQESLMAMAVKVGLTLAEADDLRKIVAKKRTDEIDAWKDKIYQRAKETGVDEAAAKLVFDLSRMSADYSFPASHAKGYCQLTALSVYLKFAYPSEFFLEALRLSKEKQDQAHEVSVIVQELPAFDIKLLPPSLTKSDRDFKLEGKDIRFSIEAIKGISEKSIAHIQSFIEKETANLFQIFQAAEQSKVNSTVFSGLVEVGCLDSESPHDRQKTVLCAKIWKELNAKEQAYCLEHGAAHNFDLIAMLKTYLGWIGSNGKPIGKESRLATLRKNCANYFEIYKENSKNPMVSQWLFEKKLLGYCPSITLSELFEEYPDLSKIGQIKTELYEKERLQVVAEVKEVKTGTAKKSGNKYAKITLADETGNIESLFTGDKWLSYLAKFGEPEEGQLIYIRGQKGSGEDPLIFIDLAEIQCLKIFMRVSDLKKYQDKQEKEIDNIKA
jgi:DNA-directed DNA polymerase III PolC